jgi:hypothetical protein
MRLTVLNELEISLGIPCLSEIVMLVLLCYIPISLLYKEDLPLSAGVV